MTIGRRKRPSNELCSNKQWIFLKGLLSNSILEKMSNAPFIKAAQCSSLAPPTPPPWLFHLPSLSPSYPPPRWPLASPVSRTPSPRNWPWRWPPARTPSSRHPTMYITSHAHINDFPREIAQLCHVDAKGLIRGSIANSIQHRDRSLLRQRCHVDVLHVRKSPRNRRQLVIMCRKQTITPRNPTNNILQNSPR